MKTVSMVLALLASIASLVWALIFAFTISGWGPGVWRWLIFSAIAIIASALIAKWPKVMAAILVVVGLLLIVWPNPSSWYLDAVLIIAGVLAFFVKAEGGSAAPAPQS